MDRSLRGHTGRPNLRTRAVAALVIVGLLVITAPIVVIPLFAVLARTVF